MSRDNIESSKIDSLIPRQLIADSQALIEFLKEYYRYMSSEGQPSQVLNNVIANRDIDQVVDEFLLLLEKELGAGFTTNIVANKQNLYKNIVQFYQAKGSTESFKLLFRLLYDTEIEIEYPKEKILIASDGRWVQQNSIFVDVTDGNPLELYGKIIDLTTPDRVVSVEVERVRQYAVNSNYYELYITKSINTSRITTGATLSDESTGVEGTVVQSLNQFEIVHPGSGFDIAQFVNIDNAPASGTVVKTKTIGSNGELLDLKFISFGIEYTSDFYVRIIPTAEVINGVDLVITTDPDGDAVTYPTHAIVHFTNNPVAQYSGEYSTNNGFLSDDIYLQDNFFYQQFSYLIKSGIQFENYKNVVDKTVHPSGMVMFGQFEINNEFDLSRQLAALQRYYYERFYADAIDTTDNDVILFGKNVFETVSVPDNDVIDFGKFVYDNSQITDLASKGIQKFFTETVTITDDVDILPIKQKEDTLSVVEVAVISLSKSLEDNINNTSSGVIEMLNDVYAENYFAEDYSEGLTSFN